jgi:hypothetical protein
MKKTVSILVVLLWVMNSVTAQDISDHQWKKRVLIVMAANKDSELLHQQIAIFNQNEAGLTERKLLIYLATPQEYTLYNPKKINWKPGSGLYENYQSRDTEMELVLIGLDGGIKHRTYSLTPALEIFTVIDGMPMRQSEMRNNKQVSH